MGDAERELPAIRVRLASRRRGAKVRRWGQSSVAFYRSQGRGKVGFPRRAGIQGAAGERARGDEQRRQKEGSWMRLPVHASKHALKA